jgi:four helix bundle protein
VRSDFRSLRAYAASASLADEVYRAVDEWRSFDRWTVGLQFVRAADSVAANIAESAGRWQPADKKRFLVIARGSLRETEHWVGTASMRGLIKEEDYSERIDEIARGLAGMINHQRR